MVPEDNHIFRICVKDYLIHEYFCEMGQAVLGYSGQAAMASQPHDSSDVTMTEEQQ